MSEVGINELHFILSLINTQKLVDVCVNIQILVYLFKLTNKPNYYLYLSYY